MLDFVNLREVACGPLLHFVDPEEHAREAMLNFTNLQDLERSDAETFRPTAHSTRQTIVTLCDTVHDPRSVLGLSRIILQLKRVLWFCVVSIASRCDLDCVFWNLLCVTQV